MARKELLKQDKLLYLRCWL